MPATATRGAASGGNASCHWKCLASLPAVAAALAPCAVTIVAWIWVLQRSEPGKVDPMMTPAFVLVPVAGHILFGESFTWRYVLGSALLVAGVVLTSSS